MANRDERIRGLLAQLDHPDQACRRRAGARLVALGNRAVGHLAATLGADGGPPDVAVIGVLANIGGNRALLALMRYVFDRPDLPDTRRLAMRTIHEIAGPQHHAKLFDFLVDMKDDPDVFVRAYVIKTFGELTGPQALGHIRDGIDDDDDFVRQCAQQTLNHLKMSATDDASELSGPGLLREIRSASGSRLSYCIRLLNQRDDAFELACQLVREDGNRTMVGLQVLEQLDRPAARAVAVRHYKLTGSDAARAGSLRLLSHYLGADARPTEVRTIEQGLDHDDTFIGLAALEAAGRSGHAGLSRRAIEATRSADYTAAAAAAEALAEVAERLAEPMAAELFDSLQMVRSHRRHNDHQDLVRTEAYLLRAVSKIIDCDHPLARPAQHAALSSLGRAGEVQAIVITGLELLLRLTPEDGFAAADRWHPADAQALVPLADHPNPSVCRRALEVIGRGAPGDTPNLHAQFEQLMRADPGFVAESVVPAILATDGPHAKTQLAQLAVADRPEVRRAAESGLRRLRNRQAHIDVDYRRAPD